MYTRKDCCVMKQNCSIVSLGDRACRGAERVQVTIVTRIYAIILLISNTNNDDSQGRSLLASKHAHQQGMQEALYMQASDGGNMQESDVMLWWCWQSSTNLRSAYHVKAKRVSHSYQEGKVYKVRFIKVTKRSSFAISEAPDNQSANRLLPPACLPGERSTLQNPRLIITVQPKD